MILLSPMDVIYYRTQLVKILQACTPGEEHYTGHFYKYYSSFTGDKGVFMRRLLRTLVSLEYLNFHNKYFSTHRWSITQKGIDYLSTYDPLKPKML